MSSVLVCVLPARGHVGPTKPIVAALITAGHDVTVITGGRYRQTFAELGAEVTVLPPEVDFDETDLDGSIPGRAGLRGLELGRFELANFVRAMPAQLATVDQHLACGVDVVLCDPLFMAGMALVLRERRPRVLTLGFLPLTAPALFQPPPDGLADIARHALLRRLVRWLLRPAQEIAVRQIRDVLDTETSTLFMDWPMHSDGVLQMTCSRFEYPRTLPTPLHFIGPTTASPANEHALPRWWGELDGSTPVVHVTQGTVANDDLSQLVEPAIAGLAGEDVLVVVTTGGGSLRTDPLPPNVRVADFLPYDDLLPRCALMISNGGYGGANHALRYGVPLVVVGASEDKREVAARVAWSGVGIGYPRHSVSPRKLRRAVRTVLADPGYRDRARQMADEIATCPTMDDVVKLITSD
ncbi:UDP:flavonoid glycosyltransferase YjiC, YdhE family [Amycolatopsis arida]|uniref:UDP:flavonoid glycosyltransferase YjiC, YdhE family n=1 Tax=Amycolatopsis arida TaxID=587909 RepID=A0A1I5V396_9PSEU|nr:nucleotide disphospho-sugar-binding domain-containing protein [Amycolatopsis arida]TDX91133.1 UDP:flavonoid glycosyltransferase YjiC (YdhE family) [Amycolatopsis arida]SFQ01979.1 UDP:flavonoid glycosyltransferase YjiC, YdhE family [Amycolatopsis arida]